jgi:hypothetical protein
VLLMSVCERGERDARLVKSAVEFAGTEDDWLRYLLCTSHQGHLRAMEAAYMRIYNKSMVQDVRDDTSFNYKQLLTARCKQAEYVAERLRKAIERPGTDDSAFFCASASARAGLGLTHVAPRRPPHSHPGGLSALQSHSQAHPRLVRRRTQHGHHRGGTQLAAVARLRALSRGPRPRSSSARRTSPTFRTSRRPTSASTGARWPRTSPRTRRATLARCCVACWRTRPTRSPTTSTSASRVRRAQSIAPRALALTPQSRAGKGTNDNMLIELAATRSNHELQEAAVAYERYAALTRSPRWCLTRCFFVRAASTDGR